MVSSRNEDRRRRERRGHRNQGVSDPAVVCVGNWSELLPCSRRNRRSGAGATERQLVGRAGRFAVEEVTGEEDHVRFRSSYGLGVSRQRPRRRRVAILNLLCRHPAAGVTEDSNFVELGLKLGRHVDRPDTGVGKSRRKVRLAGAQRSERWPGRGAGHAHRHCRLGLLAARVGHLHAWAGDAVRDDCARLKVRLCGRARDDERVGSDDAALRRAGGDGRRRRKREDECHGCDQCRALTCQFHVPDSFVVVKWFP